MLGFEPFDKISGAFLGKGLGDLSEEFFQLKQVHGDGIVILKDAKDAKKWRNSDGDAIICLEWGLPIAVRTADCVPIFVAHPSRVIAVVHAGWRGTAARILEKTLARMRDEFKLDLKRAAVAIGPAIGVECYEVGEDVAAAFRAGGGQGYLKEGSGGKFFLDLKSANADQAKSLGVPAEGIEIHGECTLCREDLFHSYRGGLSRGETSAGRNYSWLMISP